MLDQPFLANSSVPFQVWSQEKFHFHEFDSMFLNSLRVAWKKLLNIFKNWLHIPNIFKKSVIYNELQDLLDLPNTIQYLFLKKTVHFSSSIFA